MADDKTNKTNSEQKKQRQAEDGRKATLDYEADAAAVRAKTDRLRALRMARDAAAPPPPAKGAAKKKAVKGGKSKARPLSEWLDDQKKDGIRD